MPELSGMAASSQIRELMPDVPIIMLSMHDGKPLIDALRLIGARGFVPKTECSAKLLEGVDAVLRGETFFDHHAAGLSPIGISTDITGASFVAQEVAQKKRKLHS